MFALIDEEVQETPIVITGTLLVNRNSAKVLFDSGATHSFLSNIFAKSLGCHCLKTVDGEFSVRTLMGADVRITHRISSLEVNLAKRCLAAKVYILGMKNFDVILEMD